MSIKSLQRRRTAYRYSTRNYVEEHDCIHRHLKTLGVHGKNPAIEKKWLILQNIAADKHAVGLYVQCCAFTQL